MTSSQLILLVAYSVGIILNGIVFFVQKSKIDKLKDITDQIDRYFKIFNVDSFEKLIAIQEKIHDQQLKAVSNEMALKFTESYMEKFGHKRLDKGLKQFQKEMGEQFDEIGWFLIECLHALPEDKREELINTQFPKSEALIRANLKIRDDEESRDG